MCKQMFFFFEANWSNLNELGLSCGTKAPNRKVLAAQFQNTITYVALC